MNKITNKGIDLTKYSENFDSSKLNLTLIHLLNNTEEVNNPLVSQEIKSLEKLIKIKTDIEFLKNKKKEYKKLLSLNNKLLEKNEIKFNRITKGFVTYDKFRIYEGDTYYFINSGMRIVETSYHRKYNQKESYFTFALKENAIKQLEFFNKFQIGTKFTIVDLGQINDGTFVDEVKEFYNILDKVTVYDFTKDKIWTVKQIGYMCYNCYRPYCEFITEKNEIDWCIPSINNINNIKFID